MRFHPLQLLLALTMPIFAYLQPLDVEQLKGPGCVIVDSTRSREMPLAPAQTQVNVRLTDGYAEATLTQMFVNPLSHTTEIAYVFPLPEKGSVHAMSFQTQGKLFRAHIEEKQRAQQVYDSVKQSGGQAGLLLQERPNIFQQKLANLAARDTVYVQIRVSLPLKYADNWYEFAFPTMIGDRYPSANTPAPLGTNAGWNPPENREGPGFQFNVLLLSSVEFDSIVSPSHPLVQNDLASGRDVLVRRGVIDSSAKPDAPFGKALWLPTQNTYPNRDFVLRLRRAKQTAEGTMVTCKPARSDTGFFRLTLFPELQATETRPKLDVVFLVDRSGSQSGWPLATEKIIVNRLLDRLNPEDRFTLLAFDVTLDYSLGQTPVQATAENLVAAKRFTQNIVPGGGTELLSAIQASLKVPTSSDRQRLYVFLTDGFITNESAILQALQRAEPRPQVLTFGAGDNLNRYFLEEAARVGNGFATLNTSTDNVILTTDKAWERIAAPQVSNLKVSIQGRSLLDTLSLTGTHLYQGLPWTLSGRYLGSGNNTLTLRGTRAGAPWSLTRNVAFSDNCHASPTVPVIWARESIQKLETEEGTSSIHQADIIALSTKYQVLSKYTAFLAVNGIPLDELSDEQSLSQQIGTSEIQPSKLSSAASLRLERIQNALRLSWTGKESVVRWRLTNLQGKMLMQWGAQQSVVWNGRTAQGVLVASGTYLLHVTTSQGTRVMPIHWLP